MRRREFLKLTAAGIGTLILPLKSWPQSANEDPHFFLQIYVYGGIDSLFLFDGRPLSMTTAKIIHAYIKEEPTPWIGANDTQTLANRLTKELEPHRQRFSVVNGIFMSTAFDGHEQNINFLYTGNPFGGENFVPHINSRSDQGFQARPLDALSAMTSPFDQSNGGNTISLSPESAFNLIESLKKSREINLRHPVMNHLSTRFADLGQGSGKFSAGSRAMGQAYLNAPNLTDRLKRLKLTPPNVKAAAEERFIELMGGCFREGICSAAMLQIAPSEHHLDVHGARLAHHQIKMYTEVVGKIRGLFDLLASTPYDDKRSLFDVTTVMFASEFGRSLRQPGLPLDDTGTDHNSLNNSFLIGGKGLRGGLVIGETDWRRPGEELSAAHKAVDQAGLKLMGKPFDFATCRPRADLPKAYDPDDYLNLASIVNTIYSSFSVPQAKWRVVKRDGPPAPVIKALLNY